MNYYTTGMIQQLNAKNTSVYSARCWYQTGL